MILGVISYEACVFSNEAILENLAVFENTKPSKKSGELFLKSGIVSLGYFDLVVIMFYLFK